MSTVAQGGGRYSPSSSMRQGDLPPVSTSTVVQGAAQDPSREKFYARFYSGPKDLHLLVFKQLATTAHAGLLLARVMQVCRQWRSLLSGTPPPLPPPSRSVFSHGSW